jgi:thiol:disulfide interchange protein DsbG
MKRGMWLFSVGGAFAMGAAGMSMIGRHEAPTAEHVARPLPAAQVGALFKTAGAGNVTLEKVLPATHMGYTAAIAKANNGQRVLAWVSPDGQSLLWGALFDATGTNLTRELMNEHHVTSEPKAHVPRSVEGTLLDAVAQAEAVKTGTGGPTAYVFIDLNCGFCSALYQQLSPLIAHGRLRVNWIPVAILHATSLTKAAEVLQAFDRAQRLAQHEATHDPRTGEGGLAGQSPTDATKIAIAANNALLKILNSGQLATPTLLFKARSGQVFQHAGLLRDAADILKAGDG